MNTHDAAMADFQAAFLHALLAPEAAGLPGMPAFAAEPAFAVYRNTVAKACIDALEANFPVVARLVGPAWFRAVAADYVRAAPPRDARLLHYGEGFAEFLAPHAAAHGIGYLPQVARLDALWRAAHASAEAPACDPRGLALRDAQALAATVLHPHPAARWVCFDDMPAGAIWRHERAGLGREAPGPEAAPELAWRGDGVLLTRPADAVRWCALDAAGCRFLDACAAGLPLAEAADCALAADPALDLGALLQRLLEAGAFREGTPP